MEAENVGSDVLIGGGCGCCVKNGAPRAVSRFCSQQADFTRMFQEISFVSSFKIRINLAAMRIFFFSLKRVNIIYNFVVSHLSNNIYLKEVCFFFLNLIV